MRQKRPKVAPILFATAQPNSLARLLAFGATFRVATSAPSHSSCLLLARKLPRKICSNAAADDDAAARKPQLSRAHAHGRTLSLVSTHTNSALSVQFSQVH